MKEVTAITGKRTRPMLHEQKSNISAQDVDMVRL